jgi:peptidoglycan/LPS O-acetylase OafA/YrhL
VSGRLGYVPALDGLRGVAIAAVILRHFFGIEGGFYGVDLFFVLSGFLITTLLLEEHAARGRVSLGAFYARRARRLVPALLTFLLVFVGLSAAAGIAMKGVHAVVAYGAYGANFGYAFGHPGEITHALVPLWSLAEEEQFYVLWPLAVAIVLSRGWSSRRAIVALGGLALALVAYRAGLAATGASVRRLYFSPDTHADGLVLGCLLAFLYRRGISARLGSRLAVPSAAVFLAGVLTAQWSRGAFAVGLPLVEVASAGLVVAALGTGSVARVLSSRPLVGLGAMSYSLYIWQQLPNGLLGWNHPLLALPIAFALAGLSYRFVESPFRTVRPAPVPQGLPVPVPFPASA